VVHELEYQPGKYRTLSSIPCTIRNTHRETNTQGQLLIICLYPWQGIFQCWLSSSLVTKHFLTGRCPSLTFCCKEFMHLCIANLTYMQIMTKFSLLSSPLNHPFVIDALVPFLPSNGWKAQTIKFSLQSKDFKK
jgi:hypothetical protein